jgi:hypothetical protein
MGYSDLIKQNKQDLFNKIAKDTEKASKTSRQYETDERYWKPTLDAQKNSEAKIRFLPPNFDKDPEAVPVAKISTHFFQDAGGTYAENCLTTIGQKDPCQEHYWKLWNEAGGNKTAKDTQGKKDARKFTGKDGFIFCIYVEEDKLNPAAEGKVFLYKAPKTVYAKVNELMFPEDGSAPENPYDFLEGRTLLLKVKQKNSMANYESSKWLDASPMIVKKDGSPHHPRMEAVYNAIISVRAEIAPEKFKTWDELEALLYKALGQPVPVKAGATTAKTVAKPAPAPVKATVAAPAKEEEEAPFDTSTDEEEEVVSTAPATVADGADDSEEDEDAKFFRELRGEG